MSEYLRQIECIQFFTTKYPVWMINSKWTFTFLKQGTVFVNNNREQFKDRQLI